MWVAHKARTEGPREALVQTERCVAVHLEWEGLERVDSTVVELFGTIIAVLGASASTELEDLVVVVKLDNQGVVDHYAGGGSDITIRQQLKQHCGFDPCERCRGKHVCWYIKVLTPTGYSDPYPPEIVSPAR